MLGTQGIAAGSLDGDINVKAHRHLTSGRIGRQGDTAVVAVARQKGFFLDVAVASRSVVNSNNPGKQRVFFRRKRVFV